LSQGGQSTAGGAKTIRSFAAIGALDRLGIVLLPLLLGDGLPLTPAGAPSTPLKLEAEQAYEGGEIVLAYSFPAET
jgi:dihydrofolate reductase